MQTQERDELFARGWASDYAGETWWHILDPSTTYSAERALDLRYPPPPVPRWLKYHYPSITPDFQVEFRDARTGEINWKSNIGPQTWTLLCPYDEILCGGRRGGSKSAALIAWMAMGDNSLDIDDPARYSFLNEPSYRGLMLRKEYQSFAEFVDEMMDFYRPFGVEMKDDPVVFHFASGAKIYTNHLGDREAYEKYRGWGITRIGLEELTQIPDERWYRKLLGSLRNKKQVRIHRTKNGTVKMFPKLRSQILSTANPDGIGAPWVKKRFVKVEGDPNGKVPLQNGLIPWNHKMVDPVSKMTRIFIPMRLEDNPYFREDKAYMAKLMAQDEIVRRQWIDGDWDAAGGLFFSSYRPLGPAGPEETIKTPWARHRPTGPVDLRPWWLRWASLDIGYDHPATAHKFCRNEQDRRIHCYAEFSQRNVDAYELGILLASWLLPELEQLPDHQMVMYISPDAFSKVSSEKTRAEQLALGIKEILGPYGALILRYTSEERVEMAKDPERARVLFEQRRAQFEGNMGIAIKMANDNRRDGCDYINQHLRFRPILTESQEELNKRLEKIFGDSGVEAYERELAKARTATGKGAEILPKVQIWADCVELDRCLKEAIRGEPPKNEEYMKFDAEDGIGGDDALDDFRYGMMGYKDLQVLMPREYFMSEKMAAFQNNYVKAYGEELTDPTRLAMVALAQAAKYDKVLAGKPNGLTLPRASSRRHRVN